MVLLKERASKNY
uniref:Uncharacterized protein n=1 Tax=Arundo donax TaxID=35708 RepID=A0A0A9BFT7_ARUDO